MKTLSPALATVLGENVTTLCKLLTITRVDGLVMYFTDYTKAFPYNGDTYEALKGFSASAIQNSVNSATSNLEIQFLTSDDGVVRTDVERGVYDDAQVVIELIDYLHPENGTMPLFEGRIRASQLPNMGTVSFSLLGLDLRLDKPICEQYSPTCRAAFGDARCKVNLAAFTVAFTVDVVTTAQRFTASEVAGTADVYKQGRIVWATGDNAGITSEVVTNDATGVVFLKYKPPFAMQVGDTGNIIRGCLKTVAACQGYNNLPNYRGEPYIPGDDGLRP
jgi:uncharacterized phage protein (TIGR02218 family)